MSGQNPFELNGSGLVAMKGKNCVGIATDTRLGNQFHTVSTSFQKVFKMQNNILMGLSGLATDIQTFHRKMQFKLNMYKLRENRDMKPSTFAHLVGTSLYEHRFGPFFVNPLVVGLEDDGEAIVYNYDSIGCQSFTANYATVGTAEGNFSAMCESYWNESLGPQELEDVLANVLVSGLDRDIMSGWGGIVYIITPESIEAKYLKTKMV
jgi:20S proteasome subunit beta 3